MRKKALFLLSISLFVAYGMESPLRETPEEFIARFNSQMVKEECYLQATLLFAHINELKSNGIHFSPTEIMPMELIRELKSLNTEKPIKKEPIVIDTLQLEESKQTCPNCFNLSKETDKYEKKLVLISTGKKHPYQRSGCYFKFNLKAQRRRKIRLKYEPKIEIKKENESF